MMPPSSVGCENALLGKRKSEIILEKGNKIKCVLIGDENIGKTSLVVSYSTNGFPTHYVPTAYDNYNVVVMVDKQPISVQLCDTAGHNDFDPIRTLCYPETDVFMVCFSVVNPTSFNNVQQKWVPEIRKNWPDAPVLLIGTQSDRKRDVRLLNQLTANCEAPISEHQAKALASCLGLKGYIETSALTQKHLKDAFDNAILCALSQGNPLNNSTNNIRTRMTKIYPRGRLQKLLCCFKKQSD